MSFVGSVLDRLQAEHDVLFVVSGTNRYADNKNAFRIGAPADSLNSIVVNSVDSVTKEPAEYSRKGPVLSAFIKPDVSYYGGTSRSSSIYVLHAENGFSRNILCGTMDRKKKWHI